MRVRFENPAEPFHPVTITFESQEELLALLLRLYVPRHILKDYYHRAEFGPIMSCYPNGWEDHDPKAAEMFQTLVSCLRHHPQRSQLINDEEQEP